MRGALKNSDTFRIVFRILFRAFQSIFRINFNFVTLPALQKNFVNIFFVFAWEFCIEKWRGFLVNFSGLRLPRNEARKLLKKFGENSEQNSGKNSGRKFEKFGKLSFCNFPDLKFWGVSFCRRAASTLANRWHSANAVNSQRTFLD